jgi:hypothetical protein
MTVKDMENAFVKEFVVHFRKENAVQVIIYNKKLMLWNNNNNMLIKLRAFATKWLLEED